MRPLPLLGVHVGGSDAVSVVEVGSGMGSMMGSGMGSGVGSSAVETNPGGYAATAGTYVNAQANIAPAGAVTVVGAVAEAGGLQVEGLR